MLEGTVLYTGVGVRKRGIAKAPTSCSPVFCGVAHLAMHRRRHGRPMVWQPATRAPTAVSWALEAAHLRSNRSSARDT